jgi:hypothetical protein
MVWHQGLGVHNLNISRVHCGIAVHRTTNFVFVLSSLTYWKNQIVVRRESIIDHNF